MSTEKALLESFDSPGKDLDVTVNVSFGSDSSCPSPNLDLSVNGELRSYSPTQKEVERLKRGSSKSLKKKTLINDSVHGHIEVPEICMRIIDTNQFRRLSSIKQLGTSFYVYPCSKHTRWEHSLGVMHLAEKLIDELLKDFPDCCTRKDKICVMIGGLCHDLGHGPFSHLFESFMLEARPGCGYKHEQTSLDMFRYLLEENNLIPVFKELEDLDEIDITFIEELIYGALEKNDGQLVGRVEKEKQFLYQIVANKSTSIDVDKWDYYRRDNQAMNLGLTFDQGRFMQMSRLGTYRGQTVLAYESKSFDDVVRMFEDRARLHKNGYQHRVVKITDRMILDLLLAADKHIDILKDKEGRIIPLSEAHNDMFVFSKLKDEYLFEYIINKTEEKGLTKAREICQRLNQRNLYKYLGCFYQKGKDLKPKLESIKKTLREKIAAEGKLLKPDDIVLCMKKVDCGDGNNNPVEKVPFVMDGRIQFYDSKYVTESMSSIYYQEILFILRPQGDEVLKEAKELFKAWATSKGIDGVRVEFK